MPQGIRFATITGFERLLANYDQEVKQITNGAKNGLQQAAKFIQRDVEANSPLTPVRTGNLRSSWTNRAITQNKMHGVIFGYEANYALWVHFMEGAVNWTRPGSGALWFEKSLDRNHDTFMQIVANHVKPVI